MRYLVVAAVAAEAAHVPVGLDVVITGIGKASAAVATTRAVLERGRDGIVVVNVGTVGALRDGMSGLYVPSMVLNHDMIGDAIRSLGFDAEDELPVDGGDGTVLASGDTFVVDRTVRARLAERAHLVDMEAYGVVLACRRLEVPVRVAKHVSDSADERAVDWPSLVEASSVALGAWLAHNLG
jgi:nucleoside phosphorylase